jgi:hypothetical protein
MFIKTHDDTLDGGSTTTLTFVKSVNIQAFPCGRRRSTIINVTTEDRIPFDPEARLNTEANNRKHSGLNGFTQTYLNTWDTGKGILSIALAGYLFNITLPVNSGNFWDVDTFGDSIADLTGATTEIYANILINDTIVLKTRGWGYLTGLVKLTSEQAIREQNKLMDFVVEKLRK